MSSSKTAPIVGVPSTMNDSYQLNVRKLFERGPMLQPNSEVVTLLQNGVERIRYIDLQHRATKIASILSVNYNINIGDRVGAFMWNSTRQMLLLYAIPAMGAIFSPINFRLHPKDISFIITHSNHKIIFIDQVLLPSFNQIPLTALKNVNYLVICGQNKLSVANINNISLKYSGFNVVDFTKFENEIVSQKYIWPNLDERTGAALLYTSGTTGHPKGSLYSHRSIYIHLLNLAMTDSCNQSGADCILPMGQIFHTLSALRPMLSLMLGCKLLLIGCHCNDYGKVLDFAVKEECTFVSGVPTLMQSFRNALRANPDKYKGIRGVLKRATIGGSAPPDELIAWFWDNYKIELIQGWGMSETQGIAYLSRRVARRRDLLLSEDEKNQNPKSAGLPLPSVHGKIVKEKGKTMGDFYVNGPSVTGKYYNIDTPNKFDKYGWLNTGDIVSYTDRQQIIIHDRSKDMIKSGGEWISSQDMEKCIASKYSKEIDKVCVVGVYHELYRERPIVVIQLFDNRDYGKVSKREIMNHLTTKYTNYQLPDDMLYWNEIPLTGTGKISKKDVRLRLKNENYKLPQIPLRKTLKITSKL